ncbi:MAG: S8 family serine peptidase [Actinomycetes bacterium]
MHRSTWARRIAAAAICLTTLAAAVELAPAAGAAEVAEPVAVALAHPESLDSISDVRALAAETAGDAGVRIGIVTDSNGSAPGGIASTHVMVPRSEAAERTSQVDDIAGVLSVARDRRVGALEVDPLADQQYGPVNMGVPSLPAGLDGRGVTVAVIDTGVTGTHPDLLPSLSDGRARVLMGTSFLSGSAENGTAGNVDPNGHGTHVAGIIAAASGNGIGGAGVAPQAQILPIRTLTADGTGWSSDIAAAIRWAHDRGADVINMSLGAPGTTPGDISEAINYVTSDARPGHAPTVVVAAAGNSGRTYPNSWPAEHPRVIAVAATDASDQVTDFSSRGTYVDVAAPGLDVLSTCRTGDECTMSGTSMASPMAAAAAAILRGQSPARTPAQVQAMLESTARDIGTVGRDVDSGAGLVQVHRAAAATTPTVRSATAPATPPSAPSNVSIGCFATACSVSFATASNGGARVTGHIVAAVPNTWGASASMAGGPRSPVIIRNLTPATTYTMIIVSGNRVGLGRATRVQVRTPAMPAAVRKSSLRRKSVRWWSVRRHAVRQR